MKTFVVSAIVDNVQMIGCSITKKEEIKRIMIAETRDKARYNFIKNMKEVGTKVNYKDVKCSISNASLLGGNE